MISIHTFKLIYNTKEIIKNVITKMKTADAYPNYNAMSVKKSDLESNLMYTNSRKNYSSKYKLKIKASWLNELSI